MLKFLLRIIFISAFVTFLIYYYQPINLLDKNDLTRIQKESLIVFGVRVGPTSYYEVKNKLLGFEYECEGSNRARRCDPTEQRHNR